MPGGLAVGQVKPGGGAALRHGRGGRLHKWHARAMPWQAPRYAGASTAVPHRSGHTSTRCMLFDHDAQWSPVEQVEHRQIFPRPGWVEHDATEIWSNTRAVIAGAIARAELQRQRHRRGRHHQSARDDGGLGPPHRHAGRSGHRVAGHPTQAICDELGAAAAGVERFRSRSAFRSRPTSPAPRCVGCSTTSTVPAAARERGELAFGTIDSWLLWNLTGGVDGGVHATDPTNASRTMLMDLDTLGWDEGIAEEMGIPRRNVCRHPHVIRDYGHVRNPARSPGCRSAASSATSRLRPSGRPACSPARRRTPTAPATSCS